MSISLTIECRLQHAAISSKQIATAHDVEQRVLESLKGCEQKFYFVVSQPGVTAADLRDGASVPFMRERVAKAQEGALAEISEVVGDIDAWRLAEKIGQHCSIEVEDAAWGADWQRYRGKSAVIKLRGEHIAQENERAMQLAAHGMSSANMHVCKRC